MLFDEILFDVTGVAKIAVDEMLAGKFSLLKAIE